MNKFTSSDREWSEATNKVYSICEKNRIAHTTNIAEYRMWVRPGPGNASDALYKEIKEALNNMEKRGLVKIGKPCSEAGMSREVILIHRKCLMENSLLRHKPIQNLNQDQ